ncbi:LysE/ArgO family amino acid transporter [Bacilliculturomica massiliensis]|uniref:LysE/ArgO family amino acid transporter n=1 Tax=Bacilliculturomica massiliensis TaxID=1917867 RepID=UPI0010308C87|nr:LysE family transporter [Bacilliculturomica massiliensis]
MVYFFQGFTLGLAYVAPIGAQNLFVINTGLTQSVKRVYQTAFIVMFFDIVLAVACFFGVGAVMDRAPLLKMGILIVGGLALMYMGVQLMRARGSLEKTDVDVPLLKVISTACVVTWFNPQALIDGSLMLGAFKASLPADQSAAFILGVCLASASWWLGISTLTHLFGAKLSDRVLRGINIVCGAIIFCYGLKLGVSFFRVV